MTHIERVSAVLAGQRPDHPPVSFWHHFPPEAACGSAGKEAHLQHLSRYDLDFLKIMNDNDYPAAQPFRTVDDLRNVPVLRGDESSYAAQLELIGSLARELSQRVHLVTTVFNAWAVLRRLVVPFVERRIHKPPTLQRAPTNADLRLADLLREDRSAVGMALDAIAMSQANFARRCIEAGADGIFLSVRDDWVREAAGDPSAYDELVRTGDGQIVSASRNGRFNLLHVCGAPADFRAFADYPVQVINWADRVDGPPVRDVAGQIRPVPCGGVDNLRTLPQGTPDDVKSEVRDAIQQAGDHPLIVAPGCTYDADLVPPANLDAIVQAARRE